MDPSTEKMLEKLAQAEDLKMNGQYDEALAILEQLLIADPENIVALEELAENELALSQFDRAKIAALRVIDLHEESYTAHYILGFLFSREEALKPALKELRRANILRPNNAEILRCLGWTLFHSDSEIEGLVTLERALNLDADNSLILCDLGVAYMQTGNSAKAHTLFTRAVELEPHCPRAAECLKLAREHTARKGPKLKSMKIA